MPDIPEIRRMQNAFDQARRAADAKDFRTPQQWEQTRKIEMHAENLREIAQRGFKNQYQDRLNREIKRLLSDRYRPTKDYKPKWVGDSNDITRRADKNIHNRHEQRLARIDRAEGSLREQVRLQARETRGHEISFERPAPGRDGFELAREFQRKR